MEAPGCRHHNIGSRYPSGAVRVCVGFFTWVPWGFTAVSPPRSSRVAWRSCLARMKPSTWLHDQDGETRVLWGDCRDSSGFLLHPEAGFCLCILLLSSDSRFHLLFHPTFSLFEKPERESQLNYFSCCLPGSRQKKREKR